MVYLKLHRDEPEIQPPAPLPFRCPDRTWRETGHTTGGHGDTDPIIQAQDALARVERGMEELARQVDECCEPIRLSDWQSGDDDGPWAA